MDKDENKSSKEEDNMQATAKQKPLDLKVALNKISSKTPVLSGPKGMIRLNPKDKSHKDWYEDDGDN
ncbi:MAG: hypothetical protein M1609_09345 [Firmicutes bacterium]|nr:hypothetical protein [Bacillota bacterium]